MNYLKIVSKGFAGYNGVLGSIQFKDGVSVEPVPQRIADRLGAATAMVEVDADGNETPAGVGHRMVAGSKMRAPINNGLARQTDRERSEEDQLEALRKEKPPVSTFYTAEQLEEIASTGGIRGLREIAEPWGVKDRTLAKLIFEILRAQTAFLDKRNMRLQQLSEKAVMAAEEKEAENKAKAEAARKAQDELDRIAGILIGSDVLADVYVAGTVIIPAATIIDSAWKRSAMSVTGFNKIETKKRDPLLLAEIEALAVHYGEPLIAQVIEQIEEPGSEAIVPGDMIGQTPEEPAPVDTDEESGE